MLASLSKDPTEGARALLVLSLHGRFILRHELKYGRQDARHKLVVALLVRCIMQRLDDEVGGGIKERRLAEGAETKRYERRARELIDRDRDMAYPRREAAHHLVEDVIAGCCPRLRLELRANLRSHS